MDFIVELLVQLFVQIVVELIVEVLLDAGFRGAAAVARSRTGRLVVGALIGIGFGVGWGAHLSGNSALPKLLWVSLALAAAALILVFVRTQAPMDRMRSVVEHSRWSWLHVWPWRWADERLVSFGVLNVAIAAGIGVGFAAG